MILVQFKMLFAITGAAYSSDRMEKGGITKFRSNG